MEHLILFQSYFKNKLPATQAFSIFSLKPVNTLFTCVRYLVIDNEATTFENDVSKGSHTTFKTHFELRPNTHKYIYMDDHFRRKIQYAMSIGCYGSSKLIWLPPAPVHMIYNSC